MTNLNTVNILGAEYMATDISAIFLINEASCLRVALRNGTNVNTDLRAGQEPKSTRDAAQAAWRSALSGKPAKDPEPEWDPGVTGRHITRYALRSSTGHRGFVRGEGRGVKYTDRLDEALVFATGYDATRYAAERNLADCLVWKLKFLIVDGGIA